jgi:hypothetical protein
MAADISVETKSESQFEVVVREGAGETRHIVTAEPAYVRQLAGDAGSAPELLRRSFQFLLERESKESILSRFHLSEIGRYFPEYEKEIRRRLRA